jgi:hypothetical protein
MNPSHGVCLILSLSSWRICRSQPAFAARSAQPGCLRSQQHMMGKTIVVEHSVNGETATPPLRTDPPPAAQRCIDTSAVAQSLGDPTATLDSLTGPRTGRPSRDLHDDDLNMPADQVSMLPAQTVVRPRQTEARSPIRAMTPVAVRDLLPSHPRLACLPNRSSVQVVLDCAGPPTLSWRYNLASPGLVFSEAHLGQGTRSECSPT